MKKLLILAATAIVSYAAVSGILAAHYGDND